MKGFEAKSCRKVSVDTLAKDDAGWIQWEKEKALERVQGKVIQLRFTLQHARLYSFRVANAQTVSLPVPRATNR